MPYWVAFLQPQRHRLALCCLAERGYEAYCPMVKSGRGPEPLFFGYAFVAAKLQWSAAAFAPGVTRLIGPKAAPPDEVPDELVDSIRAREGRDGFVRLPRHVAKPRAPDVRPGDRVRVVSGAMFGRDGLCVGMASHQRVVILLQALGRVQLPRGDARVIQ